MMASEQEKLNIIGQKLTQWLMRTYECVSVGTGEIPPAPEEYDIPKDTGKYKFLAPEKLSLFSTHWPIKEYYMEAAEKIDSFYLDFQFYIIDFLKDYGINEGDTLYVRDFPMVLVDETLFRERKFGVYGWLEVFCREVEFESK